MAARQTVGGPPLRIGLVPTHDTQPKRFLQIMPDVCRMARRLRSESALGTDPDQVLPLRVALVVSGHENCLEIGEFCSDDLRSGWRFPSMCLQQAGCGTRAQLQDKHFMFGPLATAIGSRGSMASWRGARVCGGNALGWCRWVARTPSARRTLDGELGCLEVVDGAQCRSADYAS